MMAESCSRSVGGFTALGSVGVLRDLGVGVLKGLGSAGMLNGLGWAGVLKGLGSAGVLKGLGSIGGLGLAGTRSTFCFAIHSNRMTWWSNG